MWQSESIKEIATTLSKVQSAIKPLKTNKVNPFYKSRYADLEAVTEHIKPHLEKNGLSFVQFPSKTSVGEASLVTQLMHTSGEWLRSESPLFTVKKDQQSVGSAITYAKRQALQAAFGIAVTDEDDDGERAALLSEKEARILFVKAQKQNPDIKSEVDFNSFLNTYDPDIKSWREIPRAEAEGIEAFLTTGEIVS